MTRLEWALKYAELGWPVFPCHWPLVKPGWSCSCEAYKRSDKYREWLEEQGKGGKFDPDFTCPRPGKHPRTANGLDDATTDPEQIRSWWTRWPDANIAINCGLAGILMVDQDTYKDFYRGPEFDLDPSTPTAISGGGGGHLYYAQGPGDTFGNVRKGLPPGIDIRGHGGFVLVEPSMHASGNPYTWELDSSPWDLPLAPIPAPLRAILTRIGPLPERFDTSKKYNGAGASAYGQSALDLELAKVVQAVEGTRNNTLNDAAFALGQLVAGGEIDHGLAWDGLMGAAQDCGLTDDEAERTIESGMDAGMNSPRSSKPTNDLTVAETDAVIECPDPALLFARQPDAAFDLEDYSAEDGGILDLWFDLYGAQRMFTVGFDTWYIWQNTHWEKDTRLFVNREIERLIDAMNTQAKQRLAQATDKQEKAVWARYVSATQRSKNRVASVEGMARARCAVPSGILNTSNTLNLINGILDLDTLDFRPHAPEDNLTYCLPYPYDPDAICPRSELFAEEVLVYEGTTDTDQELCQLFWEGLGYALTTDTRHEAMFWFSGDGGNGKTVAITILQQLLGPLCFSVSFEAMGTASNYDLAEVAGKRVVFSTESERGGKLAEGHIKRIVSGERISARPIYGSPFEFKSTAKIFWGMNDLPVVRDTSNGVWRRLKLIPFLRTFTEADRDTGLIPKLQAELPGILNRALAGLKSLRERGRFPEAKAVAEAVAEYRHENNPIQQWLDERTQPTYAPGYKPDHYATTAKAAFDNYKAWAEENGRQPMNSTNFGREMRRLGILKNKDVRGNAYAITIL